MSGEALAYGIREEQGGPVLDGLYLTVFPGQVINVDSRTRELTQADLGTIRAAITEAGFAEAESWLPRQGVSWLSDGVSAGVSFRLVAIEDSEDCTCRATHGESCVPHRR